MIKKLCTILLSLSLIFSLANTTFAHNGKRDSLGGHFKAATETYHFHSVSNAFKNAKSKQEVVNLVKKYNSSAPKYNVNTNTIEWDSFQSLYGFIPSGASASTQATQKATTTSKGTTTKASNTTATGKVYSVVDGDTIKVKLTSGTDKGKIVTVRLSDIDTPETVHPTKPVQKYGKEASNRTRKLLPQNTTVKLVYEKQMKDSYGRHVAFVYKGNTNINVLLVKEGLARVDYTYAKSGEKYYNSLKSAEASAKKAKKNIWRIDGYVESKFTKAS